MKIVSGLSFWAEILWQVLLVEVRTDSVKIDVRYDSFRSLYFGLTLTSMLAGKFSDDKIQKRTGSKNSDWY